MEIYNDFSTSVKKALSEIDESWEKYEGLVICGTHTPHDVEMMIGKIKEYRENKKPFLGICAGHQLSMIERARNLMGIKDATSEEFGKKGTFIIRKRSNLRVGIHKVNFKGEVRLESFWHNYEINPIFFMNDGLLPNDNIDLFQGDNHPFFWTTQFHPEYNSSKDKPHPILVKFLEACKKL